MEGKNIEFQAPSPNLHELREMDEAERANVLLLNIQEFRSLFMDHEVRLLRCQKTCKSWHGIVLGWLVGLVLTVGGAGLTYLAFLISRHVFGE